MGVPIWEWWMWASLLLWYSISLWMSSFPVSPATILTYLGTICTREYLDYPYYPFVSSMSFGSMICVSSLRVWLTYQVATKRLHVHLTVHCIGVLSLSSLLIPLLLSLSLFLLFSSLSCSLFLSLSLSLSVNVGVHICVYTLEVIGSVEYERSVPHWARYWGFCLKSSWVSMTVLSN